MGSQTVGDEWATNTLNKLIVLNVCEGLFFPWFFCFVLYIYFYFSIFKLSVCLFCHVLFTDRSISDLFYFNVFFSATTSICYFTHFFFPAEVSFFHSLEYDFIYIFEFDYNSPLTSMYVNSKSWIISWLVFIDCCFILLMDTFSCLILN